MTQFDDLFDEAPKDTGPKVDDLFDNTAEQQGARNNIRFGIEANPDKAAQSQQLAKRYGLPTGVVEQFHDDYAARAKTEDAAAVVEQSPALRGWLAEDQNRAKIAHDDVQNLSLTESALKGLGDAGRYIVGSDSRGSLWRDVKTGYMQASVGAGGMLRAAADVAATPLDFLDRFPSIGGNPLRRLEEGLGAENTRLSAQAEQTRSKYEGNVGAGISSGVQSLVGNLVNLPAAFFPGGQTAYLSLAASQAGGQSYERAKEAGVSSISSLLYGVSDAAIEFATEKIPMERLMGGIASNASFAKTLLKTAAAEIPGEQVATVLQDMTEWATLNPDKPVSQYLAERPSAAAQTLIATVIGTGGVVTTAHGLGMLTQRNEENATQAEQQSTIIESINQLAQASKVAQRDVDTFENFLQKATEDGPVPDLYIDADTLHQSGIADQVMEVSPSVREQYQTALATGGSIRIPTSEYGARIATLPELSGPLLAHLKTDPMGFSADEAKTYQKEQGPALEAEIGRALEQAQGDDAFNASRDAVKQSVLDNLNTVARNTPAVNETYATLVAARTAVRAKQLGITPEEMFAKQQLRVQGEQVGGEVVNQSDQPLADMGAAFEKQANTDPAMVDNYIAKFGNVVDPDLAKQLSPEFVQDPSLAKYVHEGSSILAKKVYAKLLEDNPGKPVLFTAGGGGSGKTEAMPIAKSKLAADNHAVVYDSALSNYDSAIRRIDQALTAGHPVDIIYTNAPVDKAFDFAMRRKRVVPAEVLAHAHVGASNAIRKLAEHYKDNPYVTVTVVNNNGGVSEMHMGSLADVPKYEYDAVVGRLHEQANQALATGSITAERHRTLTGSPDSTATEQAANQGDRGIQGQQPGQDLGRSSTSQRSSGPVLDQPDRGSFSPSQNVVTLLKNADLSTFLHEASHYFYENDIALANELLAKHERTAGEQQIVDDVSALLKWHGFEGDANEQLDQWNQLTFEQKRAAHERTAESFEAYLFSGKAPSIELATYFQKFREYLLNVYKSLKQFLAGHPEAGKLNDEVRGVFDRMLATDEQIALAEQARSMLPLFKTAEEASKFGVDFEAYQALAKGSTQAAVEALQARGLKDMQWLHNAHGREVTKLKKQSEALRREIRQQVRTEVMQRPVYQAWSFLTRRMTEDDKLTKAAKLKTVDPTQDSLFAAIAKLGGLNKDEVVSIWGVDPKANAMPEFGKHVLKKDGRSIYGMLEVLAENGYLSVDENGKADTRELEEKFDNELRGKPEYSFQKDYNEPNQVANPEALGAGRLDAALVQNMDLPPEVVKRLEDFKMTRKTGGLHPDLVADMFGLSSGDDLARALYDVDQPQTAIEKATDARMLAEHGELATPEAIEKAADRALYNAARGKMLVADANALAKATAVQQDAGTDKKGRKRTINILPAAAKEAAANLIARVQIRNLRPAQYEAAEIKAGKATEKAKNAGRLEEAAGQARTRLFNHYAAMAAYEAQDEVAVGVSKVKKLLGKGAQGNMRGDALAQMNALAARFDFRTSLTAKEIDAVKVPLAEWVQSESERLSAVVPDLPAYMLDETYKKHYKDMTLEEFRGLIDSIKQLEFMARREQKQYIAVRNQNFEQESAGILDVIRKNFPKAFDENGNPKSKAPDFVPSLGKAMTDMGDKFIGEFISSENIIDMLEGGEFGPVSESLFGRLTHASDWKAERLARVFKEMKPTMSAYGVLERRDFARKGVFIPEINTSMTRENMTMVALLAGNKEGRERLANYGWGPAQVQAIVNRLTEKDVDLVESIWKQFDQGLWPELKALNERTRGISPPKVESVPYSINGRQVQGGYMRLKYDTELDERAHNLDEGAAVKDLLGGSMGMSSKTNQGTSTQRVQGVKLHPRLDLGVFAEAVNETVHDIAYREAIADTIRLLNDSDVQLAIKGAQGTPAYRALIARVREVAAPPRNPAGWIEKSATFARKNTVINLMSGVKTALQNFTGLAPAMAKVSPVTLMAEVAKFASPKMIERVRFAMDQSAYMRGRFTSFDRDLQSMSKGLTVNGSMKPSDAMFLALMSTVDRMVAVPVWNASFKEGMQKFGNDQSKATDYADKIVRQTQGSGRDVDLSRIQAGHGAWGQLKKVFTMFYSYFNGQLGLLVTSGAIAKREAQTNAPLAVAKFTGRVMAIVVMPAVLTEWLMHGFDNGDDDPEKWAKILGMYMISMFPIIRDIAQGAAALYSPDAKYNSAFKMSPIESSVNTLIQVPKSVNDIWTGEGNAYDTKTAIMGTSFVLGLPGKLISDTINGTDAWLSGEAGPQSVILGPPPKAH